MTRSNSAPASRHFRVRAGIDEVGRGCLAGPVVSAAVALIDSPSWNYADSKKLTHSKRQKALVPLYAGDAIAVGIGWCSPKEIDELNILQATMESMRRAMADLEFLSNAKISHAMIDGNRCPQGVATETAVIGGDGLEADISAASIVAKEFRDRWMLMYHSQSPQYGFDEHKGYGTRQHLEALEAHGVLGIHRRSFAPVRNQLLQTKLDLGL